MFSACTSTVLRSINSYSKTISLHLHVYCNAHLAVPITCGLLFVGALVMDKLTGFMGLLCGNKN